MPDDSGTTEARAAAQRRRAYLIWEQQGRPDGRQEEHWHAAEREDETGSGASRDAAVAPKEPPLPGKTDAPLETTPR